MALDWNRTQATLAGGERSHDCDIPASQSSFRIIVRTDYSRPALISFSTSSSFSFVLLVIHLSISASKKFVQKFAKARKHRLLSLAHHENWSKPTQFLPWQWTFVADKYMLKEAISCSSWGSKNESERQKYLHWVQGLCKWVLTCVRDSYGTPEILIRPRRYPPVWTYHAVF